MAPRFTGALVSALAMLAVGLPAQAATPATPAPAAAPNPAVGYMVCSALMGERNKLFLAWGFSAAGTRSVELAHAYVQMLREKGYAAASMYAPAGAPPPL